MELRFVKGNWKFGQYKLQYMFNPIEGWVDVPTVDCLPHERLLPLLEEKFINYFRGKYNGQLMTGDIPALAKIAQDHFKNQGS